jgi:hypothetical protein
MSSNRLSYDQCAYKKTIQQSTDPLSYVINPIKYENCNKCRMELGIVGGTAVSHIKGNLVDLENDLRGQTRSSTNCPEKLYQKTCGSDVDMHKCQPKNIPINRNICDQPTLLNTELLHLPPCQMIRYKSVPLPPPMKVESCPSTEKTAPAANCKTFWN